MKNISATSISTYYLCALQWKFKYILKLLQKESKALMVGSLYHKHLEHYHKGQDHKHKSPLEKAELDLVDTMFAKYRESPVGGKILETEMRFTFNVPKVDVPIIGFIDRVDEDKGVEYKTSSFDYKDENTDTFQSKIYSYALFKKFGRIVPIVYSVMNKKRAHVKKYKPQEIPIVYTEDNYNRLFEKIQMFQDAVKQKQFPPNPGTHCYWCPWGNKAGDGVCPYSK